LDKCAGDRDRAFERVYRVRIAELPCDRRDQAVLGHHRFVAEREEQEGAGAIGVLHVAVVETCVPEQRCLLVAEDARDRHPGQIADPHAVHLARRADLRKHLTRDLHQAEEFFVPLERLQVHQECAACIRWIRWRAPLPRDPR
jgi:hypothetical protein